MADGGRCIGSLNQAPFLRAVCPKACAQAFDKLGLVHDPASGLCPPSDTQCMLSFLAAGDRPPAGDGYVAARLNSNLTDAPGWTHYEKARAGSRCEPGWASQAGRPGATCSKCAANHYSSRTRAKCLRCPGGYVASAGSDSSHHCTPINPATEVHDTSSYFQPGETWTGS